MSQVSGLRLDDAFPCVAYNLASGRTRVAEWKSKCAATVVEPGRRVTGSECHINDGRNVNLVGSRCGSLLASAAWRGRIKTHRSGSLPRIMPRPDQSSRLDGCGGRSK